MNNEYNEMINQNINIFYAINIIFTNNKQVIVTNIVTTTYLNRLELSCKKMYKKLYLTLCQ